MKTSDCGCGIAAAHVFLGMALVLGGLFALAMSGPLSDRRKYGGGGHGRTWGAW
jgi:hypothetical protein